jgi:DNA-binding HxlR family transcriptional regulator
VGEWWSLLILRACLDGATRSDQFRSAPGHLPAMLTRRMHGLVERGLLRCHQYQQRPAGHEYLLTERGPGLLSALVVLAEWGRP